MMFEVQSGIPLKRARGRGRRKYPWDTMEVGGSFFVADAEQKQLAHAAYMWRRNNDMSRRFETRVTTENGVHGVRVWRTA